MVRSLLLALVEERTLRLVLIPCGTAVVTLSMSLFNGSSHAFLSDALNSERPEPLQQVLARYYLWHLTMFSVFSFKLRTLPERLAWVAYTNLLVFLVCTWSGFKTWDGSYWGSWRQHLHWVFAAIALVLAAAETSLVWWPDARVTITASGAVAVFLVLFVLAQVCKIVPDTGLPLVHSHVEIPVEWAILGAHLAVAWWRCPTLWRERLEEAGTDVAALPPRDLSYPKQEQPGRNRASGSRDLLVAESYAESGSFVLLRPWTWFDRFTPCSAGVAPCSASGGSCEGEPMQCSRQSCTFAQAMGVEEMHSGKAIDAPDHPHAGAINHVLAGCVMTAAVAGFFLVAFWVASASAAAYGPEKECLVWGDPHVQSFDGAYPTFLGQGDFYLVKTPLINIQARYLATPETGGLAAVNAIAVGGTFLHGHRLEVGPMIGGEITWDGAPVLSAFPSSFDAEGLAVVEYDNGGAPVDPALKNLKMRTVRMQLPLGVRVEVMRWANHVNVRITMRARRGGQDGGCGNFNGDATDDGAEAIKKRSGWVRSRDRLFESGISVTEGRDQVSMGDCAQPKYVHAEELCKAAAEPQLTGIQLGACIFDVCFGGDAYAAEDAAMTSARGPVVP